jgi:protein-L-isoaspartate(D-aspartate) O-methyltransferase
MIHRRTDERERLVQTGIVEMGIRDPAVIRAMRAVPRHLFVPEHYRDEAYANRPLPIGYGQTISQPFIVALMSEALALHRDDRVLEVGTGSGYQAAVLAQLVAHVYTVEIVAELADQAKSNLVAAGCTNVEVRHGDGYLGWPEHAPFDAIIVTAAPALIPPPLEEQLADGGRLVIPLGPSGGYQELWLVERHGEAYRQSSLGPVSFVPLTRGER